MFSLRGLQKGFTLIEILIVVLIISIVSSISVLTISRNNHKEMEFFAKELVQVIKMAEEQALLQPAELGLMIKEQSYQFVVFTVGKEAKKPQWSPLDDKVLGQHPIPEQIAVQLEGEATSQQPQIIISTNGDLTPFTLYIGKRGAKPRFAIIGEADGAVNLKEME